MEESKDIVLFERDIHEEDVPDSVRAVLNEVRSCTRVGASVIALSGPLGAGKTTFSQAVAKELGVTDAVLSPTFVVEKRYATADHRFSRLVHIDAYRLETSRELLVLHFSETVRDPQTLIIIEWAERVADIVPKDALWIKLAHVREGVRHITFSKPASV